jgi:hypothetical protein
MYQLNTDAIRTVTDKNYAIHQVYTNKLFTNMLGFQITGCILGTNRTQKAPEEKLGEKKGGATLQTSIWSDLHCKWLGHHQLEMQQNSHICICI